jgi:uncharacterized flavoprotein (TIGR03862 family)
MAAEVLSAAGISVTVVEAKPSVGRKFLMAGKSGLNLSKDEDTATLISAYLEAQGVLTPILSSFDAVAVQNWAKGLGQEVFTGSTGRVFPRAMKASPLLRAWMARLAEQGVVIRTRTRWLGWDDAGVIVQTTGQAPETLTPDITILAMGGASWARLGSDGQWANVFAAHGLGVADFAPSNAGVQVDWSDHMANHFGTPLKGVFLRAGPFRSRGEALISKRGLEGGGIYSISRGVREGHPLTVDFLPGLSVDEVAEKLSRPRAKMSLSNYLRKTLKLQPAQIALLQEMRRPLPDDPLRLARIIKKLEIKHAGLRPMDEAISTAGGVPFSALDEVLMLTDRPGTFVAGEMLDWEAPTGGYLITACLATGRWAGLHALKWAQN